MPKSANKDLWKSGKFQVWKENEKGEKVDPYDVEGKRLGLLGLHFNEEKKVYQLRSLSSKYWILSTVKEADAMLIGEELWAKARLAVSKATLKEIRETLPKWVMDWLGVCKQRQAYVNSTPFERGTGI